MENLVKPLVYIGIIFLAIGLKKIGFFGKDDYKILSKILMNITLPLTVVNICVGVEADAQMYWLVLLGFVCALIPVFVMYIAMRKEETVTRAFGMVNAGGFNVGSFALPMIQLFYGATGAVFCSMFDIGNALIMSGGAYAITTAMLHLNAEEKKGIMAGIGSFAKNLFTSVSLDAYLFMLILMVFHIRIPEFVGTITAPFAGANSFVAMFMIGLMFQVQKESSQVRILVKTLVFRVAMGVIFAVVIYFVLPFDPLIRQVAAICAVAPAGTLASVFTGKIGGNVALASFLNSISVIISFVIMLILTFFVF